MMRQLLRRRISPLWLIPVVLVGLPFLVGAVGRIGLGLGAERFGRSLLRAAVSYGELPAALMGGGSAPPPLAGILAAGLIYSVPVVLCFLGLRALRRLLETR